MTEKEKEKWKDLSIPAWATVNLSLHYGMDTLDKEDMECVKMYMLFCDDIIKKMIQTEADENYSNLRPDGRLPVRSTAAGNDYPTDGEYYYFGIGFEPYRGDQNTVIEIYDQSEYEWIKTDYIGGDDLSKELVRIPVNGIDNVKAKELEDLKNQRAELDTQIKELEG